MASAHTELEGQLAKASWAHKITTCHVCQYEDAEMAGCTDTAGGAARHSSLRIMISRDSCVSSDIHEWGGRGKGGWCSGTPATLQRLRGG